MKVEVTDTYAMVSHALSAGRRQAVEAIQGALLPAVSTALVHVLDRESLSDPAARDLADAMKDVIDEIQSISEDVDKVMREDVLSSTPELGVHLPLDADQIDEINLYAAERPARMEVILKQKENAA